MARTAVAGAARYPNTGNLQFSRPLTHTEEETHAEDETHTEEETFAPGK
ncbi:hypothetical protein [Actinobaculum suis]|nr:hypothetical protein [Actinobaculum suis]